MELLSTQVMEKYTDCLFIEDIRHTEQNMVDVFFHPLFDMTTDKVKWNRIKQDIRFMIKQRLGDEYRTRFYRTHH